MKRTVNDDASTAECTMQLFSIFSFLYFSMSGLVGFGQRLDEREVGCCGSKNLWSGVWYMMEMGSGWWWWRSCRLDQKRTLYVEWSISDVLARTSKVNTCHVDRQLSSPSKKSRVPQRWSRIEPGIISMIERAYQRVIMTISTCAFLSTFTQSSKFWIRWIIDIRTIWHMTHDTCHYQSLGWESQTIASYMPSSSSPPHSYPPPPHSCSSLATSCPPKNPLHSL